MAVYDIEVLTEHLNEVFTKLGVSLHTAARIAAEAESEVADFLGLHTNRSTGLAVLDILDYLMVLVRLVELATSCEED